MTALPTTDGIYLISLSDDHCMARSTTGHLSDVENQRAETIAHPLARRCFEMGRFYLRTLLGARLGLEPAAVPIGIGPTGKPELALASDCLPCHFSLSHSGNCIAIALSEQAVGVDLETRCPPSWKSIARRFFSDSEQAWIAQAECPEIAFVRLWTMKEAAVKLSAGTLLRGLRDFELLSPEESALMSPSDRPIRTSSYVLSEKQWLSTAAFSDGQKKERIFPLFERAEKDAWSLIERVENQYLMRGICASGQV